MKFAPDLSKNLASLDSADVRVNFPHSQGLEGAGGYDAALGVLDLVERRQFAAGQGSDPVEEFQVRHTVVRRN